MERRAIVLLARGISDESWSVAFSQAPESLFARSVQSGDPGTDYGLFGLPSRGTSTRRWRRRPSAGTAVQPPGARATCVIGLLPDDWFDMFKDEPIRVLQLGRAHSASHLRGKVPSQSEDAGLRTKAMRLRPTKTACVIHACVCRLGASCRCRTLRCACGQEAAVEAITETWACRAE